MFEFYFNTRVKFGKNSSFLIPDILSTRNWVNVGVIIDETVYNSSQMMRAILTDINNKFEKVIIEKCAVTEPSYKYLDEVRQAFVDTSLQAIIGIGGGSTLDTAKAIAVLINNKNPALSYRGFDKMTEKVLPVIAVPTTAGTGSEITPNASFIDTTEKRKMGINGEAIRPSYAFLDPALTITCPLNATISAGVDSIVHAVEAYVAKKTNKMARMFATEGFRRVFTYLPLVIQEMDNLSFREEVMYGAFLSGTALMNSGTGPAAAMSYPLGVHYGVPHGLGGGFFLPHVIKNNYSKGYYDYVGLFEAIFHNDVSSSDKEKTKEFITHIEELWNSMGIPKSLSAFNFNSDNIPGFVKDTIELKGALEQNPVPFNESDISNLLFSLV